jgi:hypothetical protein
VLATVHRLLRADANVSAHGSPTSVLIANILLLVSHHFIWPNEKEISHGQLLAASAG